MSIKAGHHEAGGDSAGGFAGSKQNVEAGRNLMARSVGDCMDETPRFRSPRWWPWAVAILLLITVNITLLGYKRGECVGYTIESGATSMCTSGPALSMDGTWILVTVSVVAVVYFAGRLVHAVSARRD